MPLRNYSPTDSCFCDVQCQTDIERSLPTGAPAGDVEWSPAVTTLRQLVDEAQAIKTDRDSIETQLKEVKCDMGKSTLFCTTYCVDKWLEGRHGVCYKWRTFDVANIH